MPFEYITSRHIDTIMKEVYEFVENGEQWYNLSELARDMLYETYVDDMPYGVQTGDDMGPDEWIGDIESDQVLEDVERHMQYLISVNDKIWVPSEGN